MTGHARCSIQRRVRRAGFTLAELLLASLCTATVAAAGTTMVLAVSHSAKATRAEDTVMLQGQSAMRRIARSIRGARLIGHYTTDKAVLWFHDANGDDGIQLSETELFWWDSTTKSVRKTKAFRHTMTAAEIAAADRNVTLSEFAGATFPDAIKSATNAETVVLASSTTDFDLKCNAAPGGTGLIDVRLSVQKDDLVKRMAMSAAPRAPADYLTDSTACTNDGIPNKRLRRTAMRTWAVPTGTAQPW